MRVVVLGAGLAGLAAADELVRAGVGVTVLEKERQAGGMAASFRVGPYWLDHGPHRFWSRDEELVRHLYELLDGGLVVRTRRSRIHLQGRYFDYPLRAGNVVQNLPLPLLLRAGRDYLWARVLDRLHPLPDASFEDWVVKRFGRTLYELFFGTYTEKAWGMSPKEISAEWASQRIAQKSLWEAAIAALRSPRDGEPRGLASEFYYPREGGIGAIARAYERRIVAGGGEIVLGARVSAIERERDRVRAVRFVTPRGEERIECDELVSTIPLPLATTLLDPAPREDVLHAARALEFISILFVYLEIDRPSVSPDHWIYLPEKHLAVHRVSEFKNFSDSAAPGDRTALCCEITCRAGDPTWRMRRDEAARVAESDLLAAGLLSPGTARPLAIARLRHAYPVYDLDYKARLRVVRDESKELGNFRTTGRQGLFRYNNMDHSISMGHKAARSLASGAEHGAEAVATAAEYFG